MLNISESKMRNLIFILSLCHVFYLMQFYPLVQPGELRDFQINEDSDRMMRYLHKYGYLESIADMTHQKMKSAIMDFQQFVGVVPTGNMDKNVSDMIKLPRCGMPDIQSSRRVRSYGFLGPNIWQDRRLTYRIQNYTDDMDKESVDNEIQRALDEWSRITRIRFKPAKHSYFSDLNIYFSSVDGGGEILAYAYSPVNGTIVLDDDELWTKNTNSGVNLFQIAVHETGHSLGLAHSDEKTSIMFPIYQGYNENFKLNLDDIRGISALYKVNPHQRFTLGGNNERLCWDPKIDAIFSSPDYYIYVLKGAKYWKFTLNFILVEGPRLIRNRWQEVPDNVDAAFTYWNNVTYFLKGPYMWKYIQDQKYKKSQLIDYGFPGIPNDIDASLMWSGNGKIYFFKGSEYWMLNPQQPPFMRVNETYPRPISRWNGLPNNLDAAVGIGGTSYFFKDGSYYKYDDLRMKVQGGYPRSIATDLFGCP
ncbi:hypothetical protein ILUMI_07261 [Ignelater luminosus]|uniref:Peptidase metallopeptidase domain-containing protein n=1 Tax=Ignelater luminosus TaxID=2038154 RepID=A0A8K0DDV5_IGNLU|nr:hypothetical protein ILUMI_07261 [Ignelater luminosus]